MSAKEQKKFFIDNGETDPIYSYNQTDFVKEMIAVEIRLAVFICGI